MDKVGRSDNEKKRIPPGGRLELTPLHSKDIQEHLRLLGTLNWAGIGITWEKATQARHRFIKEFGDENGKES